MAKQKRTKKPKPLSSAQEEIMNIIWERGEATVNDVVEKISLRRSTTRTTIQTLLVRMKEKGWVKTRTVGKAFVYRAARERDVSLGQRVRSLVNTCFEGSASKLVNALLEDQSLTTDEANEIRKLIDQAEKQDSKKRTKKR